MLVKYHDPSFIAEQQPAAAGDLHRRVRDR
jgi:hypothetical protein